MISINLSMALAAQDRRVVLMDADLGLANIDVLLGLQVELTTEFTVRQAQATTAFSSPQLYEQTPSFHGDDSGSLPPGSGIAAIFEA